MKKVIFGGIAIVFFAVVAAFSVNLKSNEYGLSDVGINNAEALANMSPSCPNGCVSGNTGCYCNGPYSIYKEAKW